MSLASLKSRITAAEARLPSITTKDTGGAERNEKRLARIALASPGPVRAMAVYLELITGRNEEPEDYAALVEMIRADHGSAILTEAFPNRDIPTVNPNPAYRAAARAWKAPENYECQIAKKLREEIAAAEAAKTNAENIPNNSPTAERT